MYIISCHFEGLAFFPQESLSVDTIKLQVEEPIEIIRRDSHVGICRAQLVIVEKILVAIVPTKCWLLLEYVYILQ